MNPFILKTAKFLAQRPKDNTIRILHVVSGLIIIQLLWYADSRSVLDLPFVSGLDESQEKNIHIGFMMLGLILVVRGLIPWCFLKHKTLRIVQGVIGLLLILIGGPIMDPIITETAAPDTHDEQGLIISSAPITQKTTHPGIIILFFGMLWCLIGLTGKGTTEKCLRYKEIVKKIRV